MRKRNHLDRSLMLIIGALVLLGALMFSSAAFGMLARGAEGMTSVVFSHIVLGIGGGLTLLCLAALIDYHRYRRFAPHLFVLALIATALVFLPYIGASHGGGRRWLMIAGLSFQPAEALKIATVLLAAAYFAAARGRAAAFVEGAGGFIVILMLPALLLVLQPDIGTLGVIFAAAFAVFFAAGARWRDIALIFFVALITVGVLTFQKQYVRDRVVTFFNPSLNQQTEGYQIKQSLIAIGSGGIFGRGFGQGVQKFTYLPEPMGDSIFAVAGEELGFIGAVTIVLLFLLLALRGYAIAARAPDMFGGLLATGISTYLASEAFINIGAMLGIAPLTGIPLTFISQGGSAMLVSLASAGILLNISRHVKK